MLSVAVFAGALIGNLAALSAADEISTAERKFFESEIRPLLAKRCYKCHGEKKQQSGLRVDGRARLLAGGDSGTAIEPGHPEKSLLIEAIKYESLEMPPDGKLNEEEIALLTRWVKIGAPWPGDVADAPVKKGPVFTQEDRNYWFFQPLRRPEVPAVDDGGWVRNEVDAFIFRKLDEQGLTPAEEASREALLRRATFDLWGLPPTPEQRERFLGDTSAHAYENLIDRLLESPRYGERWARHWLDLVRYADSNGYKSDEYRPEAWRYRDWAIRSLNEDKPYDRFVTEQLAGDEIAPGNPDVVVATGFLRHWPYESNQRDVRKQWNDILNDITDVTADVFLGLGFSCARCHDHKFDPILQRDYYRLQAFFTPIWPRTDMPLASAEQKQQIARWEKMTEELREQIAAIEQPHRKSAGRGAVEKFPPEIQEMVRKPVAERTPLEHQLAEMAYRQVKPEFKSVAGRIKGEEKKRWEALKKELAKFDKHRPQNLPTAFIVTDTGPEAPPTRIPGKRNAEPVEPGLLTILDPEPAEVEPVSTAPHSTGRRTALARWMTRPDNPLTTRVIVNRLWQYHFGRGLVSTASDFGRLGDPPSHPELLDWLATEFVSRGWSLKEMHRLMMTSAAYRQSAVREASELAMLKDPGNRLLWKASVRRLDAEQIRDAALAASGELKLDMYGPAASWSQPRRTIYLKVLRNNRDALLDAFDVPDAFTSVAARDSTTTPNQALLMINGDWMLKRARALAARLKGEHKTTRQQVESAYRLAYGRGASKQEAAGAVDFIAAQTERIANPSGEKEKLELAQLPGIGAPAAVVEPGGVRERLIVPDSPSLPSEDFTIEAVVLLRSLDEGARVRVIASQWSGNPRQRGWSFGVTSKKSKYDPRNLILQLVGDAGGKAPTYEVVASNLRPELNKPYYLAASVAIFETGEPGIAFYMQDLSGGGEIERAQVTHKVRGNYRSESPLVLGNRGGQTGHGWDGLIAEVRLSSAALSEDELLINRAAEDAQAGAAAVGYWRFDGETQPGRDRSPHANHINLHAFGSAVSGDARHQALVDFCHILLNSNEFLYVD